MFPQIFKVIFPDGGIEFEFAEIDIAAFSTFFKERFSLIYSAEFDESEDFSIFLTLGKSRSRATCIIYFVIL